MNDHDAAQTVESGAVYGDLTDEARQAIREVFGPPEIDPFDAAELFEADEPGATAGPWTLAGTQHVRQSRWHDIYRLVVRDQAGDHWGLEYRIGLTEDQAHELPWEDADEPLELVRLYPHEVRLIEYRTSPPAGQPA